MQTLFGEAFRRACASADAPAAIVAAHGELSYRELEGRMDACAAWLLAQGVGPRDVVGFTIADETAHLVVSLALLVLGVPQVSLPSYESAAARRRLAERLRVSRVVVVDPGLALPGIAAHRFDATSATAGTAPVAALDADPETVAFYQPTSGTTGEPKIIPFTQRVVATRASYRRLEPGERLLASTSIENFPSKSAHLHLLARGRTLVKAAVPAPTAREIIDLCVRFGVTFLDLGVLQLANMLEADIDALPATVKMFASGSRVPMRMREAVRARTAARLYIAYGTREIGAGTSTFPVDRDPALETVGTPVRTCEMQIVGEDGTPVAPGEVGEIRCRTAGMIAGYHDDPASTARRFRDGWFYSGDVGSFTPNGSLCLVSRVDDVMNLNGIKIYPSEIERVLEDAPGVRAAAAFALGSDVHGQIPVVAIEWSAATPPDLNALRAHARERLGLRVPRKILVVDALPRNATGKVLRAELVRLATASGRATTVGR